MFSKVRNLLLPYSKSIKLVRTKTKLSYIHNVGEDPLRPITIGQLLEEAAHKHGDTLAIISRAQNKRLTFIEVLEQSDRLAAGLTRIGLQFGDRVGIWAPNIAEWYIACLACARAGFTMVAINPAYQPSEIEYCIKKVGVKSLICGHRYKTQDYYEFLKAISPELPDSEPGKLKSKNLTSLKSVVAISDESLRGTYNYNDILNIADEDTISFIRRNQGNIKIDDPCNIQFTSGTTGKPKATVVNQMAMVNNGYFVGKRNEFFKKHQTICLQVPLFHAYALIAGVSAGLNGATLVLPSPGYDPNKALETITKEHCTIIYGTPTMYVDLIKVQRERKEKISIDIAVTGGATCSPHLFREMINVLGVKKVKSIYGLSELTGVVFQSLYDDDEPKSTGTVGYPQEHIEAKVVDQDGRIVPVGTPGELCIRGYSTMLGYWGDEEKTKEMIDPARWLKTGDQFIIEEDGYGRIVGRLKEMLIRGGENIFPKEIEDLLNTHPSILEAHVIGIPHERLGEEVCACVRLNANCALSLEKLKTFCSGKIAHYKIPSVLEIVDDFPKTTSGKVQKFELGKMIRQ